MNHPIMFLDRDNKTKLMPASFSCERKRSFNLKIVIAISNCYNLFIIKKLVELFYLHRSCKKVVEKSNKENLKVIKNTLPNKSGKPESLKK